MVVSAAKRTIQQVPSRGRMSIYKIQNFTISKRSSVLRIVYGILLVVIAIITVAIDPLQLISNYLLELREGSFLYRNWEKPEYKLMTDVRIFNYTNVDDYLDGKTKILKINEIGPFIYQEHRTNKNIKIYKDKGIVTLEPESVLEFIREGSIADTKDVKITVPNIALVAISTLLNDKLGYLANLGAYYSISAFGSKLFTNLTVEEYLWGYYDPIVNVANKLLPGWIDFKEIGIMDRFYALKAGTVEMELANATMKYSIRKWGKSEGIVEQGYTDTNTSIPCNRLNGAYEGIMISPGFAKDRILPIYKQPACRVYPFEFDKEGKGSYGFNTYRFKMQDSAFDRSSPYACKCRDTCLPNGFIDLSGCFYGFPIAISKPHFLDVDPVQLSYYEGMQPDREAHTSRLEVEPTIGVPISLFSMIQVNIAVRTSPANTITKPLDGKVLPLLWISMFCEAPPPDVINILRLRLVIGPPLLVTVEVVMFIVGFILGIQGFYRIWKPKYKLLDNKPRTAKSKSKLRQNSYPIVIDNKGFKDDDDIAKEAVSLLALKDDDCDVPDLLIET